MTRDIDLAIEMTRVVKADFVVRKESAYRRTEFARKRRVSVDGHELFIVAPEDLEWIAHLGLDELYREARG